MKPFDQIDHVERVRALDGPAHALGVLSRLLPDGRWRSALAGEPIGHAAHPMLVQIPIGSWVSAGWLDCLPRMERSAALLTGIGIATALPAVAAGLVDYSELGERQRRTAVVHASANALALGCQFLSLSDRISGRLRRGQWIGLAGTMTLAVGGLLGGHVAHPLPPTSS